jgi:hypothetical protein
MRCQYTAISKFFTNIGVKVKNFPTLLPSAQFPMWAVPVLH